MPRRCDLWALAGLLLAAGLAQWTVCIRAVAPAQDAVRYIAQAQRIEKDGLAATLRAQTDAPLYPALVRAAHRLARPQGGAWLRSAQWVAASMAALCVIPVYALLAPWLGRGKAALATILFALLPEVARLGADALADSTHLLLFLTALALLVSAMRDAAERASRWKLLGCGVCVGLSLLARSEALTLLPAVALAWWLVRRQLEREQVIRLGGSLALGLAGVYGAYLLYTHALSLDAMQARLMGRHAADSAALLNVATPAPIASALPPDWRTEEGDVFDFTRKDGSTSLRRGGYLEAARQYTGEFGNLITLPLLPLMLVGVLKMRHARNCLPGRFLFLFFCMYSLLVLWHAAEVGYLSSRHLLPLAPIALGWAGHGAVIAAQWSRRWLAGVLAPRELLRGWRPVRLLALLLVGLCVPSLLKPAHASRLGHRRAAAWLAEHAAASDMVLDTRGWSALYTEMPTFRHEAGAQALANPALRYVVVEREELLFDSRRARTLRAVLGTSAELVGSFHAAEVKPEKAVLVYRWDPQRFAASYGRGAVRR
ncbi:MAG: glycosyltransferase family 39 protein [Pirellulales bacterium]|nr:glycosyltransferase family 39 protein [Pirellulales bacterium]